MKIRMLGIAMMVGSALLAGGSARGAASYFDNFDSTSVGSPPAGWTLGGQTAAVVTNAQSVSPNNSVALYTPSDFNSGSTYMYRTDLDNSPTGPFSFFRENTISVNARMTSINQYLTLQAVDSSVSTAAFQLQFYQGSIRAFNGASLLTLGTYTSNEWYHVVMTTKPSTTKYSLAVYDSVNTLVASGANFDYNILTSPVGLFFINYGTVGGSPVGTTAYIDDVFVGQVPEPATLTLLVVGGVCVLRGYRRPKMMRM